MHSSPQNTHLQVWRPFFLLSSQIPLLALAFLLLPYTSQQTLSIDMMRSN